MALPAKVDLSAYRGDTWAQSFRLLRGGEPVDLADASAACWARFGALVEHLTATIGPDPGVVTIAQPAGGLEPFRWEYDLEVTESSGVIRTWARGELLVRADITNAAP